MGAQLKEVFKDVITTAIMKETTPMAGMSCGIDGCDIVNKN